LPSKTELTFYGGVNEIGGNKILVKDRGTKIFLDFGKSYKARSQFYDWTDGPRVANGIGDLLALKIIPDLSGIYREDLLALAGRNSREDRFVDAVFVSHAHSDHADYISFLREDIPIFMGETTKRIIESIEEDRSASMEYEITEFRRRPERSSEPIRRQVNTFTTHSKPITVDSISVEPVHVDHSMPACYGFIIHTSTSTIVYSGDLRMHGNKPELTKDFIERASQARPDLMLCEGTRINETASSTEKDVFRACKEAVERAKSSFVFADYSYKDIDRFRTFYNVAKSAGRRLLITIRQARYLSALSEAAGLEVPKPDDGNLALYKPRIKSGAYRESDYSKEDLKFYHQENVLTAEDVRKNESRVVATLGSYHIDELIDIKPSGGLYIHSMSEPFNEEGEFDEQRMNHWIEEFDLERAHAHCSGHAAGPDLREIVNKISPRILVPIHSEHPDLFGITHGSRVVTVEAGKTIEL
jgi:ribonuclease J